MFTKVVKKYVHSYYNMDPPLPSRQGQPLKSNEKLRQIAKRTIVFVALHDSHTEWGVRVDEVRQDGHIESDAKDILKVLNDDYDKLKTYLSRFIFCLYPRVRSSIHLIMRCWLLTHSAVSLLFGSNRLVMWWGSKESMWSAS